MGWNVYGIAIPTKTKDYNLDEIATFLASNSNIEASHTYDRNIHNTTIDRYETGILIFNDVLSSLFFQEGISPLEKELFDYFGNPECIIGIIDTDDGYVGYSVVTNNFTKRFKLNTENDIRETIEYGEPIEEEMVWLNALKKEDIEDEDWPCEVAYFLDKPDEIFTPWDILKLTQIKLMENRVGFYWEEGSLEMKNYRIEIYPKA
ncbi:hypothetical protein [Runella zeae]|uniref:hypothetical protein n=1 Tax=Runella zeae TaxID=94255 RepID=UPI000408AAC7|nr:hypothetical protein [Runella zeae]